MREDFESLTGADAAYRLQPDRGVLWVEGRDRVRFINGMLTQDVETLPVGESRYATQLDRKGHILADLHVLALDEALVLDVASGRAGSVLEILDKHLIADDVVLDDRSAAWSQVAFEGPGVGARQGLPTLERDRLIEEGELLWMAAGTLTESGIKLLGPSEAVAKRVAEIRLPELSEAHAELLRVAAGLPVYGVDMGDRHFPAEAMLLHAVSFTKGCYIGQEIVARIDSRGAVNKFLVQLRADAALQPGMEIRGDGKAIGQVTSAALSPVHGSIALGYVRKEFSETGAVVDIEGVRAVVAKPAPTAEA
jgi:folate-binding protein YgfZ